MKKIFKESIYQSLSILVYLLVLAIAGVSFVLMICSAWFLFLTPSIIYICCILMHLSARIWDKSN